MFLLTETTDQIETLTEQTESGKKIYLEGIFSTADKPNRNGRIYSRSVMETAIADYDKKWIKEGKAIGETNHPNYPIPDMRKASIMIESLKWDGDNVIGKASVMSTPEGQIVKGLIESGYKVGISSRGTGSVKSKNGLNEVQSDFRLFAYDLVSNASNFGSETMDYMIEGVIEGGIWVPQEIAKSSILAEDKAIAFTKIMKGLFLK